MTPVNIPLWIRTFLMREWIILQFIGNERLFGTCIPLLIRRASRFIGKMAFLLFFLVSESISILAQEKMPIFQSIQQGLSHQIIHTIIKDSYGYVWFGTQDGLNKFDGSNFVVYENNPKDSNSLIHNSIHALIMDRQKNLWIATSQGLNLYNREKDNFINADLIKGNVNHLNTTYISSVCQDDEGDIRSEEHTSELQSRK